MSNEFKAGDLVFELTASKGILLTTICRARSCEYYLSTDHATYTGQGVNAQLPISRLFHATPENRQALVTLYGEDAVPELPVRGSELTRQLLEKHKYVMCWVCQHSDEQARKWPQGTCIATAVEDDGFTLADGGFAEYAVPVDMDGNEITGTE